MAKAIQFPCPACGGTLRLPLEMAAAQGPCPRCHTAIIAPDPFLGLGSRLPDPKPLPSTPPSPAHGIQETPAPPETRTPPPATAALPPATTAPVSRSPHSAILVLSCLLSAVISLVAGYFIGTLSARTGQPTALPTAPAITPPPNDAPSPPPPVVEPVPNPEPEPQPQPAPAPPPAKASAAAEAALKAFLDAPDWANRAAHTLSSDSLLSEMEKYSHTVPDGPTPYQSISIQNSYTDKRTGDTLFIYQVITPEHPVGFPVAVSETSDGWRVDWQTFVEFRDDHFVKFADGPVDETRRFHLIVSAPPPDRAKNSENEHFSSFLLSPPLPDRERLAYVSKASDIHSTLQAATADDALFAPVLELTKRKTPDGKTYLEITGIPASDWLPTSPDSALSGR